MKFTTKLIAMVCAVMLITGTNSIIAKSPKKIIIGTGSTFNRVCFLDEKNNLTGFEVEALKAIGKLLPQYEFELKILDFNAILISLETGKVDIAAHQFEGNADRRTKFLYADEGVTRYDLRIAVRDNRNDINSLDDLAKTGATVEAGKTSSNKTYVINKWNSEHGNKLKVILAPDDPLVTIQNITSGKTDAFINIDRTIADYKATYNAKIKIVGQPISLSNAYYLYRKNDPESEQLKKDIDKAIVALKTNGALKQLSVKWLGGDFIPPKGK
jgi:L-cystine transport system substrate-binding protein